MVEILKALVGLFIAVLSFAPSLIVWGVLRYLERHEREHERKREQDIRSFATNSILNRILRRK